MIFGTAIQRIGSTPSVEDVDTYMKNLGMRATVIGKSVQGRDLIVYDFPLTPQNPNLPHMPTVLFLSLVHGQEPMGLLSLMTTAQILAKEGSSRLRGGDVSVQVVFFPLVNVDGYIRNLECGQDIHRGNMRNTGCESGGYEYVCSTQESAALPPVVGVDLNRNFPLDWSGPYGADVCDPVYHGPEPFSEPETQAIRHLVEEYNVVAAMSFHSLRSMKRGKPLLIHPYASSRPMSEMPEQDAAKFRSWGRALNTNGLYKVGNAQEAIEYTAGGTTIDWLYGANNITAFVVEVLPVCDGRWCPPTRRLYRSAREYGNVGRLFVELAVHGRVVQGGVSSIRWSILFMLFVLLTWMTWTWKMPLWSFVRRLIYGKFKDVSANDEIEMQHLKSKRELSCL